MKIAIIGYGGHAREVRAQMGFKDITFFVDDEYAKGLINPISSFNPKEYKAIVAVGDPDLREKMVKKLPTETEFMTFIHPTALLMDNDIQIGEGSFIGAYSILTTNITLGKHSLLNRGNQIGHDSNIGDYFSAMPGAVVSGNVVIGHKCYMGTNSSIREKIMITNEVKIGSNAAIVKNILSSGTYVGVPGIRKIK